MVDRASFEVKDALLSKTIALPAAPGSVYTVGLDLGLMTTRGARVQEFELKLWAPILTTTELPDTKTVIYDVETATDLAFTTPVPIAKEILVQTGAGGVGAAAATVRYRIPTDALQFIRIKATQNTAAGDQSGKSMIVKLLF